MTLKKKREKDLKISREIRRLLSWIRMQHLPLLNFFGFLFLVALLVGQPVAYDALDKSVRRHFVARVDQFKLIASLRFGVWVGSVDVIRNRSCTMADHIHSEMVHHFAGYRIWSSDDHF